MTALISLEFDDCFEETVLSALDILKKYKIKATFAVPVEKMGKEIDKIKVADEKLIRRMVREGHEIAGHAMSHNPLAKKNVLSWTNIKNFFSLKKISYLRKGFKKSYSILARNPYEEIKKSKEVLSNFSQVVSFTYPGGAYNESIKKFVSKGYKSARTTDRGLNSPETDKFELKTMLWDKNTTVKEANNWVDKAISKNRWLIETFHLLSEKNRDYEYSSSIKKLIEHLKYLSKKSLEKKILIKTRGEILR